MDAQIPGPVVTVVSKLLDRVVGATTQACAYLTRDGSGVTCELVEAVADFIGSALTRERLRDSDKIEDQILEMVIDRACSPSTLTNSPRRYVSFRRVAWLSCWSSSWI